MISMRHTHTEMTVDDQQCDELFSTDKKHKGDSFFLAFSYFRTRCISISNATSICHQMWYNILF